MSDTSFTRPDTDRAITSLQLREACQQMLDYIEMKLAHDGSMSVEQILERLKTHVPKIDSVSTSHHVGCQKTTRQVDLQRIRTLLGR